MSGNTDLLHSTWGHTWGHNWGHLLLQVGLQQVIQTGCWASQACVPLSLPSGWGATYAPRSRYIFKSSYLPSSTLPVVLCSRCGPIDCIECSAKAFALVLCDGNTCVGGHCAACQTVPGRHFLGSPNPSKSYPASTLQARVEFHHDWIADFLFRQLPSPSVSEHQPANRPVLPYSLALETTGWPKLLMGLHATMTTSSQPLTTESESRQGRPMPCDIADDVAWCHVDNLSVDFSLSPSHIHQANSSCTASAMAPWTCLWSWRNMGSAVLEV